MPAVKPHSPSGRTKNVFPATKRPVEFSSRSRQPKGNERQRKAIKSNHGDLNQVLPFLPKHRWEHLGSHSWHSSSLDAVAPCSPAYVKYFARHEACRLSSDP